MDADSCELVSAWKPLIYGKIQGFRQKSPNLLVSGTGKAPHLNGLERTSPDSLTGGSKPHIRAHFGENGALRQRSMIGLIRLKFIDKPVARSYPPLKVASIVLVIEVVRRCTA